MLPFFYTPGDEDKVLAVMFTFAMHLSVHLLFIIAHRCILLPA